MILRNWPFPSVRNFEERTRRHVHVAITPARFHPLNTVDEASSGKLVRNAVRAIICKRHEYLGAPPGNNLRGNMRYVLF